ncbi:hypothetical protein SH601_02575 [Gracilibacillus sp. S3-1-1]|uniref:Uncharacterized protein n=1 Tax=Gracilibacillus pellucidus TaxID=3095368 RepID=A0ACC6M1P3_9BACI|nr:hypothetical protein [Gracilibacillus sp. S3-1-1]MDX8044860.1 hypothetical protein [Gracilibacillus sp. S3-1-1]
MSYCPNCGGQVQDTEKFCVTCGERLPDNIHTRLSPIKSTKKWWLLPISSLITGCIIIGGTYFLSNYQTNKAATFYEEASEMALIGDYEQASTLLTHALDYKDNFPAAKEAAAFLSIAKELDENSEQIQAFNEQNDFSQSLRIIRRSENQLKQFSGDLPNQLLEQNMELKNQTLLNQATHRLHNDPSKDDLKSLVWEVTDIQHEQTSELLEEIKQKLITMTYQDATALLNELQFSKALRTVDDTLQVVENSEQLNSLRTTINKDKTSFESAEEQRFEQALSAFEEEQEQNKSDALEVTDMQLEQEKENWIISGEIKSVATVPIHSILVHYSIRDKNDQIIEENEVYATPETLYSEEIGHFEFTHFDINKKAKDLTAKIEEITWYLD